MPEKDESTSLPPETQLEIQQYINRYLGRISALAGGLNILVILGGLFYLYVQGLEIVRIQAEDEVETAVSKFELDAKLADRLVALGVADETVRALSERTQILTENAISLENRSQQIESSISTILGADDIVITRISDLIKNYDQEIDQSIIESMKRLEDRFESLNQRKWQSVASSRRFGQIFKNLKKYPIQIAVTSGGPGNDGNSNSCDLQIYVDGSRIAYSRDNWRNTARLCFGFATVPPGSSYEVRSQAYPTKSGRIINWHELY